jgi:Zn-dependent protease
MLLDVPAATPYDLRFRMGFPVRIHPLFRLGALVMGWGAGNNRDRLLWVGCVLISILVHEFGHAVVAWLTTGQTPRVVLHVMGGLCVYDPERQSPWQRLAVLFCGPGAGFVLAALVLAVARAVYGLTLGDFLNLLGWGDGELSPAVLPLIFGHRPPRLIILWFLFQINLLWGLINLLPIYPLDGGQIAGEVFTLVDRRQALWRTHILSAVVAGGLALYVLSRGDQFQALFLAYFAGYNLHRALELRQARRVGPDPGDWWRG